ncbi:two-component system sensor histidine kinase YesM [Paenibacillus phyllosphaerae]|uniref:Two-component system sensor histidine kinase YesM n=1 Tax=Paenibacillus phyllosphaerae TaxID=274593 RepID=A0A7W5FNW8_9BACL|nr:histidine kinase [Paenibacillus phyllosphaerae]MBB3111745.1 two-component system sensor histidine kinase YesM [Paenibacillus phyllosphaerae]
MLRTRLLISYLLLILLPLLVLGTLFYRLSLGIVTDQAQDNFYQIVRKNNEIMDVKLRQIDGISSTLFTDKELFRIFNELNPARSEQLLEADRRINAILAQRFAQTEDLFAYQIWTSYFKFGPQNMPQGDLTESHIYKEAKLAGGRLVWNPTYDFAEMFNQPWLSEAVDYDYRYLFTATRLLNFSYLDNSTMANLDADVERPVLAISMKADLFQHLFEDSIPAESNYFVVSSNGSVVAHSDQSLITEKIRDQWVYDLLEKGSGTQRLKLDGKNMLVVFDRSDVTGWLSVVVIPERVLVEKMVPVILTSTITIAAFLALAAVALGYFIFSRMTGPIKHLMVAMRFVGEGDFHAKVEAKSNDEIGILIHKFNTMNDRIRVLVNENYEIKLREQQAEIQALNFQMNPHFLYNTLNVMNWVALENGQRELSKMLLCLSNMLHYTTRKDWDAVHLSEEINWMSNYFYLMAIRFEDKFTVHYDIEPALYGYTVPRLLFQPFVENAIIHGFEPMESGGLITITGKSEGNARVFTITDNGCGIAEETITRIMHGETPSVGIANTIARIRHRYGDNSEVRIRSSTDGGTSISIRLPFDTQD